MAVETPRLAVHAKKAKVHTLELFVPLSTSLAAGRSDTSHLPYVYDCGGAGTRLRETSRLMTRRLRPGCAA